MNETSSRVATKTHMTGPGTTASGPAQSATKSRPKNPSPMPSGYDACHAELQDLEDHAIQAIALSRAQSEVTVGASAAVPIANQFSASVISRKLTA